MCAQAREGDYMYGSELDAVLGTVENPIRRRILAKLSEEPSYQLQLSKELGLSQQLVAKHLDSMEQAGFVTTIFEDSPRGPKRKEYMLTRSISVTIDVAPNLFRTRVFSFGAIPRDYSDYSSIMAKISEVLRYPDEASKIGPLAEIIDEIDRKLKETEEQRAVLLYMRNLALREVARASNVLKVADKRKILNLILREQVDSIELISQSLGLQESVVGEILEELEKEFTKGE